MREIVFRAKRIDNGEWIKGWYYQKPNPLSEDGEPIRHYISPAPPFGWEIDPDTVGQYTGFKDKNGVKIFEGDICDHVYQAYPRRFFNRGIIFYDEEHARFAHMLQSMNPELGRITTEAWEVVGNIHDNPELLKEKCDE